MSWKMKRNTGGDMQLYYRLKGIFSGQLLLYRCVKLPLQYSNQRSHIMCWFPMRYLSYRPIISAYASSLTDGQPQQSYFGELNTNMLADGDSCKHVCDMTNIQIKPVILCSHKSYVKFDTSVSMRGLYLYPIDSTICKKTTRKHILKKKSNRLEFSLNCTHSGLVNITVYFKTHGHYCSKYYTVRLICDSTTTTSVFSVFSTEAKNNSDSTTNLYITLGIFLSTLVNAVIVYFVCQRSRKIPRVRQNLDDINIGIDGHVDIPLNVLNNQSNNVTVDNEDFSSTPCVIEMITKV
ncbi:uncharacterized protein LOC132732777 isoform X2 [Ruditapes philippinarum]|nr:uncharacterized protein LOC132732777 isoform X2 [Ruditapes philippinarum]